MSDLELDGALFRVDQDNEIEVYRKDPEWIHPQHAFYLDRDEETRLRHWLNARQSARDASENVTSKNFPNSSDFQKSIPGGRVEAIS